MLKESTDSLQASGPIHFDATSLMHYPLGKKVVTIQLGKVSFFLFIPTLLLSRLRVLNFLCPGSNANDRGHVGFVLSVCLSVANFNLRYTA